MSSETATPDETLSGPQPAEIAGYAIAVDNVSKHYLMFERPDDRLKQMIVPRLQRAVGLEPKRYYRDFAAVSNVSFTVGHGETVGIIGRNGSGKSTMLQMICGTLQPTSGKIAVNGRIAALLELGAGFNPEFTGRENVFLNAAILGLRHDEIEARFDAIARFADIGMFIDQPVKTYSSGMYVRLAFAVAINVDPDILVVDEALAVGDEAFQRKCFARIEDIKDRGGTILFVSHGAQTIVQLCDRAILMDGGEAIMDGRPKTVVGQYQRLISAPEESRDEIRKEVSRHKLEDGRIESSEDSVAIENTSIDLSEEGYDPNIYSHSPVIYPENGVKISEVQILNKNGAKVNILIHGQEYIYRYKCQIHRNINGISFSMLLKNIEGVEIFAQASHRYMEGYKANSGEVLIVSFSFNCLLMPGTYFSNAGVSFGAETCHRIVDALSFRVASYSPERVIMRQINLALNSDRTTLTPVTLELV